MSIRCKINRNGETLGVLPLSDEERQDILAVIHDEKILNTIVNSFLAITENLSEVVDNEYEKGHFKEEDIEEIKVDLADSYDEFVIYHNAKTGTHYDLDYHDSCKYYSVLEVVTEEVAIANDNDFLDENREEEYELYNDYSMYVPLELSAFAQRPM